MLLKLNDLYKSKGNFYKKLAANEFLACVFFIIQWGKIRHQFSINFHSIILNRFSFIFNLYSIFK